MTDQEFSNFAAEQHLERIEKLTEKQHQHAVKEFHKAIQEMNVKIQTMRQDGDLTQATMHCAFLKTMVFKMSNHYEMLLSDVWEEVENV